MRIVFIGTVASSRALLQHLIALRANIVGVVARESSSFNADFARLDDVAEQAGIPCLLCQDINAGETVQWIQQRKPDIAFCFGWSQLIRDELLRLPRMGIVGYHPALLPQNRGRHPLIWALALGLEETGSTFFFMDGGADSGDILSRRRVAIAPNDDAGSLYTKMIETAKAQIGQFLPRLAAGTFTRTPQDHSRANVWRKRTAADGRIDWRMPAMGIHNLIRALAHPYPGATVLLDGVDHTVWRSEIHGAEPPANAEPGRVLALTDGAITVKTGRGAITLLQHDLPTLPQVGACL